MNSIILNPQPLNKQSFNQFGDVVEIQNHDYNIINNGYAQKYPNLASIDTSEENGETAIHIFFSQKKKLSVKDRYVRETPIF